MSRPRFHLAFPVRDLEEARTFYGGLLGCAEGRSSPEWVDFDFHGHQIVAHLAPSPEDVATNPVDGEDVPVRHFGVILDL
ncbi:MAG: dioxygenase, partial [Phenylobacterium sp.]|nr:dioxygenase [Phenylobacterium sp.]